MEMVKFSEVLVDPAMALKVPAGLAMRRLALPLARISERLFVAMANPDDGETIGTIERLTGLPVSAVKVEQTALRKALLDVYGDGRSSFALNPDDPATFVDAMLRLAVLRGASDIHLTPEKGGLRIRMRIDGVIEDFILLPQEAQNAIISRIKVMSSLDIAEKRAPQDGSFNFTYTRSVDVRTATLPVKYGERITLRLLDATHTFRSLDALGLLDDDMARISSVLAKPHGLILLTGPTGSGKTTTLYAAIRTLLNSGALNILTVEDPIEYEIDGVAQAEVDSSDKVNFSKALRSLLRHDPDVIMIGEIRDEESLSVAVRSALTGHLVLSTLHTNDAVSSVTRLRDMGLMPHKIAATLRMTVSQRLVRALCPKCRMPSVTKSPLFPELNGQTTYTSSGCLYCAGRGYRGRTGLFELFIPTEETALAIAKGELNFENHPSLREDAIKKLRLGKVDINSCIKEL